MKTETLIAMFSVVLFAGCKEAPSAVAEHRADEALGLLQTMSTPESR